MKERYRTIIRNSLTISSNEIERLIANSNYEELEMLLELLLQSSESGNILVTGVGTSGVAAQKIVHSLRCQQLPAHFLSPGDALHGAAGVIQTGDLVIVISNGGTSVTVNQTAEIAKKRGAKVVAVTAQKESPLSKIADNLVMVRVEQESDYAGILATASILCVIALFDAVISVIMAKQNFNTEGFYEIHPDGRVGHEILRTKSRS